MKGTGVFVLVAALCVAVSSAQGPIISPAQPAKPIAPAPAGNPTTPAPAPPQSVGEAMLATINAYQKIMPCGAPELGLSPLAPYRQDKITFNVNEEMLRFTGDVTNFVLSGFNNFIIIDLKTKGNRTTFDMIYEDIDILGEFDTKLYENLAGFNYNVRPKGLLNIHLKDVRINGEMTIGTNLIGGMVFKNIKYYIDIGDVVSEVLESQWSTVVNRFFNKYVRETTLLLVQENREAISDAIAGYITPLLNAETLTTTQSQFINQLNEVTEIFQSIQCNV